MSQKNEVRLLFLALFLTLTVLGGVAWWLKSRLSPPGSKNSSLGETILVTQDATPQKKAGVEAFEQKDYKTAIERFQSSLQVRPNDPETLIYLNNAKAAMTATPLKIAVVVPINTNLNVAQEILRGVAQSQNEINRQNGSNGRLLQVEIANDDNVPEQSRQVAKQLVADQEIVAVVGHNSSNASLAAAPIYEQGQLVMISPTSNAVELADFEKYIFRTVPSVRLQAETLSQYTLKVAQKKNLGICADTQDQSSQSFKEQFSLIFVRDGGRIIEINCDLSVQNFQPLAIISDAASRGADGLFLTPSVNRLESAIQVAQANQNKLALFGSSTLYTYQTLEQGKIAVNGLVLSVPWHPKAFSNNPFPQNAKNLWKLGRGEVNWRTALAYDATQVIISGIEQGGQTRQLLEGILASSKFSYPHGASGIVEFMPSGDRNATSTIVQVKPDSNSLSGTGFDFVPIR